MFELLNLKQWQPANDATYFFLVVVIFLVGAFLFSKMHLLTRYGSIVTAAIGIFLTAIAGINWILPVLYFFFTSVFFTRLNRRLNKKRKSGPRNAWQVLANILPAVIVSAIYIITQNEILILFYISLIAAVTADTWASEIGPVFNKKCLSIKNFKTANAGTSGGISVAGTLAALLGAGSASLFSYILFYDNPELKLMLLLALSGFLATFVDSLLGAFWEPVLLKRKFFDNRHSRDSVSPNDFVNFIGSASAPVFFFLLNFLF